MNMFFHTSADTVGMTKNGSDEQQPHDALTEHRLIEQQRQQRAADDGDGQHAADEEQRVAQRLEEGGVGQEVLGSW